MKRELDNFIIESDIELDYFDEIVNHILNNEKRIFDFFKIKKLPHKVKILLLSYEPFKEHIVSKYGEIMDYVSGDSDSPTNTIRILNIDDQIKYTIHKDVDVDKVKETALHEIVHQCHHLYHNDYRGTTWFSEGLATNLSNQDYNIINLDECDFEKLRTDFRHYKRSYPYSYTLVNYVLSNYDEDEIEELYSNPDYLRARANMIFEEARTWVNEQLSNKSVKNK